VTGGLRNCRLLFVCSGNTCRSPLAEALARRWAEEREWESLEVRSAGTSALPGLPASEGALRAARRHGLDLGGHRSSRLGRDHVEWADLVLAMAPHHLREVAALGGGGKGVLLTAYAAGEEVPSGAGDPVPDPFGGDDEVYEETYRLLAGLVERAMRRLEREGRCGGGQEEGRRP